MLKNDLSLVIGSKKYYVIMVIQLYYHDYIVEIRTRPQIITDIMYRTHMM